MRTLGKPPKSPRVRVRTRLAQQLLPILLAIDIVTGCSSMRVPTAEDALANGRLPIGSGLAFGHIRVEGWKKAILAEPETNLEFQNRITGQNFSHAVEETGDFFWVLPAGHYTMTSVWSGFEEVTPRTGGRELRFTVLPDSIMYLGTLLVRVPSRKNDFKGGIWVLNEFETATPKLRSRYRALVSGRSLEEGLMVYR